MSFLNDNPLSPPSDLAAITTTLLSVLKARDHVLVTDNVDRPSRNFCNDTLAWSRRPQGRSRARLCDAQDGRLGRRTTIDFLITKARFRAQPRVFPDRDL
jgi:hypothetical protein